MLVSFGAALFVLVPLQMGTDEQNHDTISRVIQGIATGIGFLGAGEISRERQPQSGQEEVHGLTSAAAIWGTAALGVAAGCGLWQTTLIGALLCALILRVVKKLERFG